MFALGYNIPVFLRGFQSAPFNLVGEENAKLTLSLPDPASLLITILSSTNSPVRKDVECTLELEKSFSLNEKNFGLDVIRYKMDPTSPITVSDLAPGEYEVVVYTGRMKKNQMKTRNEIEAMYYEEQKIFLEENQKKSVAFTYAPMNPAKYEGKHVAELQFKKANGQLFGGERYTIEVYDDDFGWYQFERGMIPASGIVTLKNLGSGENLNSFDIEVGNDRVSSFRISTEHMTNMVEVVIPPRDGDVAPDIELVDIVTEEVIKLSDFRGQVVGLDFWATWCGPCQDPMEYYDDVMKRNRENWEGKAIILAVSIDDSLEALRNHVKKKDWTQVRHLWSKEKHPGWKSIAPETYGIKGVPTFFLIDPQGKIITREHSSKDLEREINRLLEVNQGME